MQTAVPQKLMTSNWMNAPTATLFDIVAIITSVVKSIEISTKKNAKNGMPNYMIGSYLHNLTRHISMNVPSASYRCRSMTQKLHLCHAVVNGSVLAVLMPIL